jgi:hypothetical protein
METINQLAVPSGMYGIEVCPDKKITEDGELIIITGDGTNYTVRTLDGEVLTTSSSRMQIAAFLDEIDIVEDISEVDALERGYELPDWALCS